MADLEDLSFLERWSIGLLFLAGIIALIVAVVAEPVSNFFGGIAISEWGVMEWGTIGSASLIIVIIFLGIFIYSEDETPEDSFITSRGFLYVIGSLFVFIILINSGLIGFFQPDPVLTTVDQFGNTVAVPEGYVDYGTPQPYGYGNYGPPDEGILGPAGGAAAGCGSGMLLAAMVGQVPPLTFLPDELITLPVGCVAGAAFGYTFQGTDFDGDPTTGW